MEFRRSETGEGRYYCQLTSVVLCVGFQVDLGNICSDHDSQQGALPSTSRCCCSFGTCDASPSLGMGIDLPVTMFPPLFTS